MEKVIILSKISKLKNLPRIANNIIYEIKFPCTIIFEGELASGKTTLIKEIAGLLRINKTNISSPTFNIVNQYKGRLKNKKILFNHFDLYRIDDFEQLISLPFDYFFRGSYINCIEWGRKFLPSIYEYSERLYLIEIFREDIIKEKDINEEFRIIRLSLIEEIII